MESSSSARGRVISVFCIMATVSLLSGLFSTFTASAQPAPSATQTAPSQTTPQATPQPPSAESLQAWHGTMSRAPVPKTGCFVSSYPSAEWHEVPCMTTPPLPQVPARGGGPPAEVVGNGTDWTAKPLTGLISAAVGSFDDATGVTSETDSATGNPDTFSLQINSNSHFDPESNPGSPFSISPCSGAVNPSVCNGWQQFIYYNSSNAGNPYGAAYIEYWLYNYGPTCPPGGVGAHLVGRTE